MAAEACAGDGGSYVDAALVQQAYPKSVEGSRRDQHRDREAEDTEANLAHDAQSVLLAVAAHHLSKTNRHEKGVSPCGLLPPADSHAGEKNCDACSARIRQDSV